ncbi:cyclin-dependent kinase inhibitor 1B-like [Gasterosteus aculeatus]|uniref:cyclin-dependent kinase inhibitor 1B-like isoform X1 n=1 Tax=Gasterosteus aculeatus aculeatus TaxID=481459 RepID=UPI001A97FE89|nr:cyclin-dependent kinase inhibitor 1B-like isoform X1 [Gasterosteus aculeatus aculeatus]
MSDVRLSNGSPTLERTDSRVSDHPKPSACRILFGRADHVGLKRELTGHFREMEEVASAKWGFDFANHRPLVHGRIKWELVDCRDVPDFYNKPPRREKKGVCSAGNNKVDLNGNHSCVVLASSEDTERSDGHMECTEQCTGMRKRPACHEPKYFPVSSLKPQFWWILEKELRSIRNISTLLKTGEDAVEALKRNTRQVVALN